MGAAEPMAESDSRPEEAPANAEGAPGAVESSTPDADADAEERLAEAWSRRLKGGLEWLSSLGEEEDTGPFSFEEVFRDELRAIRKRDGDEVEEEDPYREAVRRPLVGLAFSGGGIRSATFNLGVLQALARLDLLRFVHYLSTVSGGGYIGGWLVAWLYGEDRKQREEHLARLRRGDRLRTEDDGGGGADEEALLEEERLSARRAVRARVRDGLSQEVFLDPATASADRTSPIGFLRRFSNYLAPQSGFLSSDSWTIVATYLRNLILNLLIVFLAVATVLLLPRLWLSWILRSTGGPHSLLHFPLWVPVDHASAETVWLPDGRSTLAEWFLQGSLAALLVALVFTSFSLERRSRTVASLRWVTRPWVVVTAIVLPFFLAAVLLAHLIPLGAEARWMHGGEERMAEASGATPRLERLAETVFLATAGGGLAVGVPTVCDGHLHRARPGPLKRLAPRLAEWRASLLYTAFWVVALVVATLIGLGLRVAGKPGEIDSKVWAWAVSTAVVAGFVGSWVLRGVARTLLHWVRPAPVEGGVVEILPTGWVHLSALGPPLMITVVVLIGVLHVGLMGRAFGEDRREIWSRIGACLMIANLVWLALFGTSFYGAKLLLWVRESLPGVVPTTSVGWLIATAAGVLAGTARGQSDGTLKRWLEPAARVAPYVFTAGLLVWMSIAVHWIHGKLLIHGLPPLIEPPGGPWIEPFNRPIETIVAAAGQDVTVLAVTIALLALVAVVLSCRVDVNEFSMHHFYRSRLVRCYLGAARRRKPNLFTGFDPDDDIALNDLDLLDLQPSDRQGPVAAGLKNEAVPNYPGPYPIFNASVNLASGEELAWQQRRTAPFIFTPRYYGWDTGAGGGTSRAATGFLGRLRRTFRAAPHAYRRTRQANDGLGVSLGTAMGISGAAVSPQMGEASSPALSFLMTVFNARLGWWMGNPKREQSWHLPGPRLALLSLMRELFGAMDANAKYVSLSDGGFFDNLGLYELVRRRCRFIVVSDAEADPDFEFNALGNAIRRCRSDLGVEIELDVESIRERDAEGRSRWHCAVGRINYSAVDPDAPKGVLVYLKASLTGDEPEDVRNYRAKHPAFPHQSTGDQSFVEAQFESYRMLGYHVARDVFESAPGVRPRTSGAIEGASEATVSSRTTEARDLRGSGAALNVESVFVALQQAWYPPSRAEGGVFTRHAARLDQIWERLRSDDRLAYLDDQLFVELSEWRDGRPVVAEPGPPQEAAETPRGTEAFRAGFYLSNSMMQLMESVYHDLDLEREWRHPDNRGWLNLFEHWVHAPIFRQTWAICASTFGARFQRFCERRLRLRLGVVTVTPLAKRRTPRDQLLELVTAEERAGRLNRLEAGFIERFDRELPARLEGGGQLLHLQPRDVSILRLQVLEPEAASRLSRQPRWRARKSFSPEEALFSFTVGFALTCRVREGDSRRRPLVFLRIRSHLRKLGLGRRAIFRLFSEVGLGDGLEIVPNELLSRIYRPVDAARFAVLFRSAESEHKLSQTQGAGASAPAAGRGARS